MESEDKQCAGYNWSIRNSYEDQNPQLLPDHPSATELQKVTLMSTAHSNGKCWGKLLGFVVGTGISGKSPPDK